MDVSMSYEQLCRAVRKGYQRKFDRHFEETEPNPDGDHDDHPVELAARYGRPAFARRLLEKGFDPQGGVEEGQTPLHLALREDHTEVAQGLVEHGAKVNVEDASGNHPLQKAPYDYETVKALTEAGADPTHENDYGNSFLSTLRQFADGPNDPEYGEFFELLTEEQLNTEASGEPDPAGLAAGHERVNLDGDPEQIREWMWEHLVPPLGQADTVQGELLRAAERLRGEAHRNGNINWNDNFELLLDFLKEHLCDTDIFSEETVEQTRTDIANLRGGEMNAQVNDEIYARLKKRVVEYCEHHPELIEKPENEGLNI